MGDLTQLWGCGVGVSIFWLAGVFVQGRQERALGSYCFKIFKLKNLVGGQGGGAKKAPSQSRAISAGVSDDLVIAQPGPQTCKCIWRPEIDTAEHSGSGPAAGKPLHAGGWGGGHVWPIVMSSCTRRPSPGPSCPCLLLFPGGISAETDAQAGIRLGHPAYPLPCGTPARGAGGPLGAHHQGLCKIPKFPGHKGRSRPWQAGR